MYLRLKEPPVLVPNEWKGRYDIWASHTDPELHKLGMAALRTECKRLEAEVEVSQLRSRKIRTFFMFEGLATGAVISLVGIATESAPLAAGGLAAAAVGYIASKNYDPTTQAEAAQVYVQSLLGKEQPGTAVQ